MHKLYYDIELPCVTLFAKMQYYGIYLDKEELLKVGAVDNLKIDNEELEKFTFGFYKFDNNEIKEFERRYNLKHDIKDIEEHTRDKYKFGTTNRSITF